MMNSRFNYTFPCTQPPDELPGLCEQQRELVTRWREMISEIEDQIFQLENDMVFYRKVMSCFNKDGSEDIARLVFWMEYLYAQAACIGIRRQCDKSSDVINLRRLILDIKQNAVSMVVVEHPYWEGIRTLVTRCNNDVPIEEMDRELKDCVVGIYTNRRVAHWTNKKAYHPKFEDAYQAIDMLAGHYRKLCSCLHSPCGNMIPIEFDVRDMFLAVHEYLNDAST